MRHERPEDEGEGESGREGEECSELKWKKVRNQSRSGMQVLALEFGWGNARECGANGDFLPEKESE